MRLFSVVGVWFLLASLAFAQTGVAVRELALAIAEQLGRKEAGEFAKFGGEAAVKQLFERAAQEGGEVTARHLADYAERYGVAALRAAETSPGRIVPALDRVGSELVQPAIYAAAREPALITKLVTNYGDDALKLAAKHPGVGAKIATSLGREGIDAGLQMPTSEAIRLARYADEIAASPVSATTKRDLLKAIAKAPKRILGEIEKHPNVLLTAVGCATLIMIANDTKDLVLGVPGNGPTPARPGFLERSIKMIIETFKTPISAVIALIGLGIVGWFSARIWVIVKSRHR